LSLLHQKAPDLCHGAIGPERLVVTPQARLVIVEHVLGAALDQLHYTHEQYWKTLRIPLPRTGSGPHFDRRADITQAGMTALALIVGRPIAEERLPGAHRRDGDGHLGTLGDRRHRAAAGSAARVAHARDSARPAQSVPVRTRGVGGARSRAAL
jgi:hypothetical protein